MTINKHCVIIIKVQSVLVKHVTELLTVYDIILKVTGGMVFKGSRLAQYFTQHNLCGVSTIVSVLLSDEPYHGCSFICIYINTIFCCCCLPTPMTLASGGSPMFPLVVHQPAFPSIWPAVQSHRRGLSANPGVTMWYICGCS